MKELVDIFKLKRQTTRRDSRGSGVSYSEMESAEISVEGDIRENNNSIGDVQVTINLTFANGESRQFGDTYAAVAGGFGNGSPENGDYTVDNYNDRGPRSGWPNAGMTRDGVGFSFNLNPTFDTGRTLLRIHPDGNNEGTLGCIGLTGNAIQLTSFRDNARTVLTYITPIPATLDITGNPNNNGRGGNRIPNVNE